MTDALFDTTVLIDLYHRVATAERLSSGLLQESAEIFYSPVTVFELSLRHLSRDEEFFHSAQLARLTQAPFDDHAARVMAAWLRNQPRSGRKRMLGDAIIAATAASLGATIYTRNPRDFTRFYTNVEAY